MSTCVSVISVELTHPVVRQRCYSAECALDKAPFGASWEGRGKRVGFPHFSVDEFFVVSSFSHGEEMLLRSRSDYSSMVPLVCSWLG